MINAYETHQEDGDGVCFPLTNLVQQVIYYILQMFAVCVVKSVSLKCLTQTIENGYFFHTNSK